MDQVWSPFDFLVMGLLLFSLGLAADAIFRKFAIAQQTSFYHPIVGSIFTDLDRAGSGAFWRGELGSYLRFQTWVRPRNENPKNPRTFRVFGSSN